MPLEEHEPGQAFPGVIGRTTDESSPAWPRPVRTVTVVQGRTQMAHPKENLLREGFGHLLRSGVITLSRARTTLPIRRSSPDRLGGLHNHIWRVL
jgi:hypothetical protein